MVFRPGPFLAFCPIKQVVVPAEAVVVAAEAMPSDEQENAHVEMRIKIIVRQNQGRSRRTTLDDYYHLLSLITKLKNGLLREEACSSLMFYQLLFNFRFK